MAYSEQARFNCINSQLLPRQALDPSVLAAIRGVSREKFVPEGLCGAAYVDEDISLGQGRYLPEPAVFARLVGAAAIRPEETVLDVGCGTGYSAAVLSRLAAHVVALEERGDLAGKARLLLQAASGEGGSAEVLDGPLAAGCSLMSPYDAIIFEGGVQTIPPVFFDRLAAGGRLACVELLALRPGETMGLGRAALYRKEAGGISRRELFDASVALLPGFERQSGFVF